MGKNIVIVGAGYAGILTAKKLAKRLKKKSDVRITIIDKHPYHTMLTELHEVAANRTPEDHVRISLKKVFAGRRVDVRLDTVTSIDFDKKTVNGKSGSYAYDYLVMAAGSKPTYFGTPGADQYAYKLWSFDDAVRLKHHIIDAFKEAASETDIQAKSRLLTFYIVGAGFTGVEMAGELAEWVPFLCEEYEIERRLVRIVNVDMLDRVVPTFPEHVSAKADKRLRKMKVDVVLKTGVSALGDGYIELKQGEKIVREETATVIWTAGVEGSDVVQKIEPLKKAGRARLQTDEYLRAEGKRDVYVAGDNIFYIPENQKTPVPQMVENAEQSAHTVAHNITAEITGNGELEKYQPKFHGAMLCIGGRYGSAYVGTDKHKFSLASFFAMFAKHFINLIYFIQVCGWNKIAGYLRHEFFTIRNRRSFVGGHFSNRTPSFLLVLFRIWLGAVWVFEGVMKIVEGWMKSPKLEGFFGGAAGWFNAILGVGADGGSGGAAAAANTAAAAADAVSSATGAAAGAVTAVADAVSSATGAASGSGGEAAAAVGKVLFNIDFLGLFKAIFVSGKPLAESTISDYAFKLDIPLMNWFVSNVILANPGVALAMQIFIVIAEILIGLSMMGGLLTTFSSLVSLVLLFMFASTTGLYLSSFWMGFGAIALMFGAGKVFGLDYYVSPLLKRGWRNIGWVRRLYIYHD
jgi:NADH dehydrogenase